MKRLLAIAAGLSLAAAGGFAVAQTAAPAAATCSTYAGEKLASKAKITIAQARTIALKARPGQITDQELENEGGGSGLRYSFDIKSGGKTHEVGVDAKTGGCWKTRPKARTRTDGRRRGVIAPRSGADLSLR